VWRKTQVISSPSIIKCENCGADMLFNPLTGGLSCPYCDSQKEITGILTRKRNYYEERQSSVVDSDTEVYKCSNCGGEVVFDSYVTATKCPFCSATNIVKLKDYDGLKPDGILPFLYTKEMAHEAGKAWIKKKFFALSSFKKSFAADNFNGVYVPSYLYSSDTYTTYKCRLGKYYYITVGSGKNRRTVRKVRWTTYKGDLRKYFPDVMVEATRQLTQDELSKIAPYDVGNVLGYQKEYLAGFSAEKCDATLDSGFACARNIMESDIKREVLSRYSYDVVGEYVAQTDYPIVAFNYTLVPLWIYGCKHKEKVYRFIVNGRNGKSYGKYPLSPSRITLTVVGALGIIAGIACIILANNGFFS
jgi:DNA-directed RNA polymerase subunit RPC12/RpoP